MLLLAIDWGGVSYRWDSPTITNLFWGAGYALSLFLVWEHRKGDNAMLPLRMFRNPIISTAAAAGAMSYGGLYVIIIYLPLWFQAVKGVSPLTSGVYYLPSVITTTLAIVISGILGLYLWFFLGRKPKADCHSIQNWLLHPLYDHRRCYGSYRRRPSEHYNTIFTSCSMGLLPAAQWHCTRYDVAAARNSDPSQPPKGPALHRHSPCRFLSKFRSLGVHIARADDL